MFAQFPEHGDMDPTIGRASLSKVEVTKGTGLTKDEHTLQSGAYLITSDYKDAKGHDGVILKVRDVRTGNELWSAPFKSSARPAHRRPEQPNHPELVARFRCRERFGEVRSGFCRAAQRDSRPQLRRTNSGARAFHRKDLGSVAVDTGKGSFKVEDAAAVGDWLFVEVNGGRTLAYSLSTGELKSTLLGESPIASVEAGLLALTPSDGQVQFYSLPDFKKLGRAMFGFSRRHAPASAPMARTYSSSPTTKTPTSSTPNSSPPPHRRPPPPQPLPSPRRQARRIEWNRLPGRLCFSFALPPPTPKRQVARTLLSVRDRVHLVATAPPLPKRHNSTAAPLFPYLLTCPRKRARHPKRSEARLLRPPWRGPLPALPLPLPLQLSSP